MECSVIDGRDFYNDFSDDNDDETDLISPIPQFLLDQPHVFMTHTQKTGISFFPNHREGSVLIDPYDKILGFSDEIVAEGLEKLKFPFEQDKLPIPCKECCIFILFLRRNESSGPYKKTKLIIKEAQIFPDSLCTCGHMFRKTSLSIALSILNGLHS